MAKLNRISTTVRDTYDDVSTPIIVSLAKAWLGIGIYRPARTNDDRVIGIPDWLKRKKPRDNWDKRSTPSVNRWNYEKLYSIQLGDYSLPVSAKFALKKEKELNTSYLVDGPAIIQQTRKKEAEIDVTIRIGFDTRQTNLQILKEQPGAPEIDGVSANIVSISTFLDELYEDNTVFRVANEYINDACNVEYCMMTKYRPTFTEGMGTYIFEFTLTEVLFGENVLTFDLRQLDGDTSDTGQIGG